MMFKKIMMHTNFKFDLCLYIEYEALQDHIYILYKPGPVPAGLCYRMVILSNPLKKRFNSVYLNYKFGIKKIQWYLRTRRNLLLLTTSLKKIFYNYKIRVRFLVVDPPAKFAKQKTQFSIGNSVVSPSAEVGPRLWKRCNNLFSKFFFCFIPDLFNRPTAVLQTSYQQSDSTLQQLVVHKPKFLFCPKSLKMPQNVSELHVNII